MFGVVSSTLRSIALGLTTLGALLSVGTARPPVEALRPDAIARRAENERRARELEQICGVYFQSGNFAEEVRARTEYAAVMRSILGPNNWRVVHQEALVRDAGKAAAADAKDQARVIDARKWYQAGMSFLQAGRHDDAMNTFAPALPASQQVLGKHSALTTELSLRFAISLKSAGRHKESLAILRLTLRWMIGTYGEDHPLVAEALAHMADELLATGQADHAEEAAARSFRIHRSSADDTFVLATAYYNVARFHNRRGKFIEAEREAREGAERTASASDDPEIFTRLLILRELAVGYAGQGRAEDAAKVCRRALDEIDDRWGADKFKDAASWFQRESEKLEGDPLDLE